MKYDLEFILVNAAFILIYYLYLSWRTRHAPHTSVHVFNAKVRERWVEMIMNDKGMGILAVQTLRNSVMAANFMASTSILLIIGALNLSEKISQWVLNWHPFGIAADVTTGLWQLKLGLLVLDFFIAFYFFSMSIRLFNHVGYMISLPANADTKEDLLNRTIAYLNKAGRYYTIGNRAFYFSLPIIMWFLGPYFLSFGTALLVLGLAILDKPPR